MRKSYCGEKQSAQSCFQQRSLIKLSSLQESNKALHRWPIGIGCKQASFYRHNGEAHIEAIIYGSNYVFENNISFFPSWIIKYSVDQHKLIWFFHPLFMDPDLEVVKRSILKQSCHFRKIIHILRHWTEILDKKEWKEVALKHSPEEHLELSTA